MTMKHASLSVGVCHWRGNPDRFFGKYKSPETGRWDKIPGGAYPPEVNTRDKALACAVRWYEVEMADRALKKSKTPEGTTATWPEVCDLFLVDVKARLRGADGSRHEAETRTGFLRRSPILCARSVREHEETLGVAWLRTMLSEPLKRKGREDEPRDALTVRNVARVLDAIYKFAQAKGYYPKERRRPTEADEFRAEIAGALKEKAKLGKEGRVACPTESVRALVHCEDIPQQRRLMRRTAFLTGVTPGELHGLRVGDYRRELGVRILDVQLQWTLPKKNYPSRHAPLKTVWRKRKIPVHASLEPDLDAWVAGGWKRYVGRDPKDDDFLFPDPEANAFREESCEPFLAELRMAGCETTHKGRRLDRYSLRHSFATIARRAGIPSDARDRLLGHRPKDMKSMYYEDDDLPLLAAEVAKIPAVLDADGSPAVTKATKATPPNAAAEPHFSGPHPVPETGGLVPVLVTGTLHASGGSSLSLMISAEEEGFEPTEPLRVRRFSKPVP
jgi:integrase